MSIEAHDVVIIGGGIIGISMAYYLAKDGVDVCLVEKKSLAMESSGRCAGGIGQSHREEPDLPLAKFSVQLWKSISEEMDVDIEYRQHNNLRLAMNDEHAASLQAMVERERAGGLEVRFLDRAETKSRVPYVTELYLGSVLSPTDGSANPYLACFALARAAVRLGAVIHENREVTGFQVIDGTIQAVLTKQGPLAARQVVNAAGAWAASIGQMLGIRIPATNQRSHLLVTERLPHFISPFLSTDIYGYFRQTLSGNVLIGYPAIPLTGPGMPVTYEAVSVGAKRAATIIPRLCNASLIRSFTGFTVWTPDYLPVVGRVEQLDGFYVAAAFCGLGFAIGPGIGKLMAELLTTGRTSLSINAYRLERFTDKPVEISFLR
jgi:sarcosine oxidase, subunit beta